MKSGKKGRKSRRRKDSEENALSDGDDIPVVHMVSTAFDAPEVNKLVDLIWCFRDIMCFTKSTLLRNRKNENKHFKTAILSADTVYLCIHS